MENQCAFKEFAKYEKNKIIMNLSSCFSWWEELDSNQRTLTRPDLQSGAFNHSATFP